MSMIGEPIDPPRGPARRRFPQGEIQDAPLGRYAPGCRVVSSNCRGVELAIYHSTNLAVRTAAGKICLF